MSGPANVDGASPIERRTGVNAHVHLPPNFSAFRTTAEAVERAAAEGLAVLGGSNYYDFSVYDDLAVLAQGAGLVPLFGLEAICYLPELRDAGVKINDPGNPGKMYVCGKGLVHLDPLPADAAERLAVIRATDEARIGAQVARLNALFAEGGVPVDVTVESVVAAVAGRAGVPIPTVHLQERHVAQAFAEALAAQVGDDLGEALERLTGSAPAALDAVSVQNHLRSSLMKAGKPGYVPEDDAVSLDLVLGLVVSLGGIPCYPILADGASPVCGFEESVDDLAAWLLAHGVPAVELIPNRNDPVVLSRYVTGLRAAGLVVLAGTEHNTLDMVPMLPECLGGVPLPDDVAATVWEGACVVAAHQDAVARGEQGFVGPDGTPDPAYPDADARIRAWARTGERLIQAVLSDHAAAAAER
ncbi:hypothetical protein OEB99_07740 [Actinotalea sp. M2MS4P-6]|uniref:hypothetical protein n=1 Tax=Actinotalea sp. M2MS4P-6 TaxID=2983762 RepID=UPI0021E44189|nr:hypothetical protein [Actinotalea sp. M2MS4P-6]MCV2394195.1 hypothetical protein [Actinotalea sp. M2MS4P-6]